MEKFALKMANGSALLAGKLTFTVLVTPLQASASSAQENALKVVMARLQKVEDTKSQTTQQVLASVNK